MEMEHQVISGWLLDLYADHELGVVIWILGDDGKRHQLHHNFPISFFAAGEDKVLRSLWKYLNAHPIYSHLTKVEKETVENEFRQVLQVLVPKPSIQPRLLVDVVDAFPEVELFDTDIPLSIRYAAEHDIFPFARVWVAVDEKGAILDIQAQDSRWDLNPLSTPFRVLRMEPDADPNHERPTRLIVEFQNERHELMMANEARMIEQVNSFLISFDPDFVITNWGDDRIFHYLQKLSQHYKTPFNPNRDQSRTPAYRKGYSYWQYGRVLHRGPQTHLFGRFHIDRRNAMTYGEYGLRGALRQSRVTCLPIQEMARKSPGAGITAMFMHTAQKRGVLYPRTKAYVEDPKNLLQLDTADQGGLVMKPLVGVHSDVVQIDFSSMYPSIMALWNVSPEMVGSVSELVKHVPGIYVAIDQSREGIVSETLKPLLDLRLKMKTVIADTDPSSMEHRVIKAESSALKWLLVVCFGYQGYDRFKLGKIEAHESVTAISRWILQQTADIANSMGCRVLHMYVDGLWLKRKDERAATEEEIEAILRKVEDQTGLPIAVEAIYKWIAFLSSRQDNLDPVPNRYFGQKSDGSFKVRGISSRRHDTPPWIAKAEATVLDILGKGGNRQSEIEQRVPYVMDLLRKMVQDIQLQRVSVQDLIVTINMSKSPSQYKVRTAAARAGLQLQRQGKNLSPGQKIRYVYTLSSDKVKAWNLVPPPTIDEIDTARYIELLLRMASDMLKPFGVERDQLEKLVLHELATPMFPELVNVE